MNNSRRESDLAFDLVERWGFQIGDEDSAFGELLEIPTALMVLSINPLSLMIAYQIATPQPSNFQIPLEIAALVNAKRASVVLEGGYAWLSLYNLRGKSVEEIQSLFEQFGSALKEQKIVIGPGCAHCGTLEWAELIYSAGKCVRILRTLQTALLQQKEQTQQEQYRLEQERNRPSSSHAYALPWVVGLAGVGWMVFWVLIDVLMEYFDTNTISMPHSLLLSFCLAWVSSWVPRWASCCINRAADESRQWPPPSSPFSRPH